MASRGPLNEERVLRAVVRDFLTFSAAAADLATKQVRLREALRRVAPALGMPWLPEFNTKTTSLRTLGRALWKGCKLPDPKKNNSCMNALKQRQKHDLKRVLCSARAMSSRHANATLANAARIKHHVSALSVAPGTRQRVEAELEANGVALVPRFVPDELCRHLLSRMSAYTNDFANQRCVKLTETSALGAAGMYYNSNWTEGGLLRDIQTRLASSLGLDGASLAIKNTVAANTNEDDADDQRSTVGHLPLDNAKAVLLCYTDGAENWAHQDDNRQFGYQALLMLSEPSVDFDGGELYVLNRADGEWTRTAVPCCHRGDVVVFRSNGPFFHGMSRVTPGSRGCAAGDCCRVAVGLFHKV
jgi:hypothetical protein